MMKSTLASMIQTMLIFMIINENPSTDNIFFGGIGINGARLICGLILHMSAKPEVRCAIELMEFIKCYPE